MRLTDEQVIEYMYRNGHFSLPVADYITKRLKENEQLMARAARIREAFIQVQHDMDGAECRDDLDGIKGYIDEALSDTPADYHNPADEEALKQAREALKQIALYDEYMTGAHEVAKQTLTAINKVLEGLK